MLVVVGDVHYTKFLNIEFHDIVIVIERIYYSCNLL